MDDTDPVLQQQGVDLQSCMKFMYMSDFPLKTNRLTCIYKCKGYDSDINTIDRLEE